MQVDASVDRVAAVFKAVSDPTRVRILATLLAAGELCVCHVEAAVGLTQSRASRHLAALRRAGLVAGRRDGAWVHYAAARSPGAVGRAILRVVRDALAEDPATRAAAAKAVALRAGPGCGGRP